MGTYLISFSAAFGPRRGVHDVGMDESLPPDFHKATLFWLPKRAFVPTLFMLILAGNYSFQRLLACFSQTTMMFMENLPQPLFRGSWAKKLIYMIGTYLCLQHVTSPSPPPGTVVLRYTKNCNIVRDTENSPFCKSQRKDVNFDWLADQ